MEPEVETKLCTNCQQEIAKSNFQMHEIHCKRNIVLCPECKEPVRKTELEQHHEEEHAPKPCDLCGRLLPRDQLDDHKEDSCPEFKLECKYCDLEFRRADLFEHAEQCGSRTDFCELCNCRVMLKDMEEHKGNKCASVKVEDSIDITAEYGQDQSRAGMLFGQQAMLSPDGYPFFSPGHASFPHPAFSSFLFSHTHMPPPHPPPAYERQREESLHVDPQWLASVADVCGEENLDQVLAQNMMVQGSYSAASARPHVHDHEHGHGHASSTSDTHMSDADLARKLQEELNREQYRSESSVRPKTPEFIKTLSGFDYSRNFDVEMSGSGGDRDETMAQDMEQRDAEMARRIHERDLAYAQRNQGMDVDHQGFNAAASTEQEDAELARQIHERDLAYAQRNLGVDPNTFGASTMRSDAELARQMQEQDLTFSQGTRASNVDPEGFGVAATTGTEQSDAEMARRIHERDVAYSQRHTHTSDYHHKDTESYNHLRLHGNDTEFQQPPIRSANDARIAEAIHEEDIARVQRINRDKELALKLQAEEEVRGGGGGRHGYTPPPVYFPDAVNHGEGRSHSHVKDDDGFTHSSLEHQKQKMWENHHQRPVQPVHVPSNEQPRPKTPPPAKVDEIPCQYCQQLFPFEDIHQHETRCYFAGDSPHEYGYKHGHPSSAVLASDYGGGRGRGAEERRGPMNLEPLRAPLEDLRPKKTNRYALTDTDSEEEEDEDLKILSTQSSSNSAGYGGSHGYPYVSSTTGAGDSTRNGYHGAAFSNPDEEVAKGPCSYCRKLFPIKDLLRHEAICYIRSQIKRSEEKTTPTHTTTKPVPSGKTGRIGSRPNLAIRFPTTERTETDVLVKSGATTGFPDKNSTAVGHSARARQQLGSGKTYSGRYRSSEQGGDKPLELEGRAVPMLSKPGISSRHSASWKPPSVRKEGGMLTTTRPTAQPDFTRSRREEKKLDFSQHYTPHYRDTETRGTKADVFQYSRQPKPLHPTSETDQDL